MNDEELRRVQRPQIGVKYHCAWAASGGMVWRLVEIRGNIAILETKHGKRVQSDLKDLREIQKNVQRKALKTQNLVS